MPRTFNQRTSPSTCYRNWMNPCAKKSATRSCDTKWYATRRWRRSTIGGTDRSDAGILQNITDRSGHAVGNPYYNRRYVHPATGTFHLSQETESSGSGGPGVELDDENIVPAVPVGALGPYRIGRPDPYTVEHLQHQPQRIRVIHGTKPHARSGPAGDAFRYR